MTLLQGTLHFFLLLFFISACSTFNQDDATRRYGKYFQKEMGILEKSGPFKRCKNIELKQNSNLIPEQTALVKLTFKIRRDGSVIPETLRTLADFSLSDRFGFCVLQSLQRHTFEPPYTSKEFFGNYLFNLRSSKLYR